MYIPSGHTIKLPGNGAAYNTNGVVVTVPKKNARTIASQLEEWGIRAIWNFAPTDLHVSDDVCVKNVHLDESLMTLSYNFRNRGKEKYSYHSYMDD